MQTVQPSRRLAVIAEILSRCSGCLHSIQNDVCSPSRNLGPIWQVNTSVIGPGRRSPASSSLTKQATPSQLFASRCAAKCWPAVPSMFFACASRLRQSRQSVHCALRKRAASPSLATLRQLRSKCFYAIQVRCALQGEHKQCSIGSCHCLPTPRMRCLTIRSTGPIAACG